VSLAAEVDRALDPRKSLPERERAIAKLNVRYGATAVTAAVRRATRR
jgi:hypothetical protein